MEALRSGRGDCDEAAAAFVTLARSLGLEADLVGGLVYREGAVGPALYPHAWATVRLGGVTVAVDPALGQAPADASHVPLGYSAAEAAARLSRGVQIAVFELR
jgi:transglutaminase-like putative cysteine protease